MSNEVTTTQQGSNVVAQNPVSNFSMSLQELKQRASMVSQIKSQIMVPNVHFGKIPGCGDKPTLLKNGAEMLCMAFRLASDTKIEISDLGNGHREYTITTMLMSNGELVATGVGSCSTMESKYRYRGNELILVGDCPKDYWNKPRPSKYNGQTAKKDENGVWKLFKKGVKTENPDIADTYNTVLKMASKRSLIDATLKATGGSCEFTQDIEDMDNAQQYVDAEVERPAKNELTPEEKKAAFVNMMSELKERDEKTFNTYFKFLGYEKFDEVPAEERQNVFKAIRERIDEVAKLSAEEGETENG